MTLVSEDKKLFLNTRVDMKDKKCHQKAHYSREPEEM